MSKKIIQLLMLAALGVPFAAQAATTTITSCADDGSAGTLRSAINTANAGDTVVIPASCNSPILLTAAQGGDILINKDLTVQGQGPAVNAVDGGGIDRVFDIAAGFTVTFTGFTIQNGNINHSGGGIRNMGSLSLTNCVVTGNTSNATDTPPPANGGGGIYNGGILNLTQTTVSGNKCTPNGEGGGILSEGTLNINQSTISGNTTDAPFTSGGIKILAPALIINSTISGNTAGGAGGGITNQSVLSMTNSTISGNTAASGGGIDSSVMANLTNVTIASNTASGNGGGVLATGTFNLKNSILAKNTNTGNTAPDCFGIITSQGFNLVGVNNNPGCTFTPIGGDQIGTLATPADPLLSALASNGGPTQTNALQTGSSAIDTGGTSANSCPSVDQRGATRPQGAACDKGAFEAGPGIALSTFNVNFGTVSTSATQPVTITSNGTAALLINAIAASGSPFSQTNNCPIAPATLAPGSSCMVTISFAPTATGVVVGSISITSTASGSTPQTIFLTGNGTPSGGGGGGGCNMGGKVSTSAPLALMLSPLLAIAGVIALKRKGVKN